jgi:hypothetical protein
MKRTKEDIILDIHKAQIAFDKALMEIGLLYYPFHNSEPEKINIKVDEARKAELRLQELEYELAHFKY